MFIKSKILRSPHAFATRIGGVSTLEHTKSMNLAFGRGDDDATVLKNLEIFANEVGFAPQNIVSLPQIHSNTVFRVSMKDAGQGYYARESLNEGDGYVTDEKGLVLGVKTADCVPILFEAEKRGKIVAVGAVHAGWRGTVSKIQQNCVSMLCEGFNICPQNIRVAIGPCIHKCCYEVDVPFFEEVNHKVGETLANRFVVPKDGAEGKFVCDLVGLNEALLEEVGILKENIDVIDACTCCSPEKFFSHRYSKGLRGTMLNVIFMR